jgi:hypothetical protein
MADPFDEAAFQRWYASHARRWNLNPNPDDPLQQYDYRSAYRAGATPDPKTGHWPSTWKQGGHQNLIVGGFHTQTGERVAGTPRAKSAAELVRLGWDPAAAARLAAIPEPSQGSMTSLFEFVQRFQRPPGGTR